MCGALVFIDAHLLGETLGHPAAFVDVLALAWAASSVSVVGGALGSSFESDEAVREAAYSGREQDRHRARQEEERADSGPAT